jgi:hypothetical protein
VIWTNEEVMAVARGKDAKITEAWAEIARLAASLDAAEARAARYQDALFTLRTQGRNEEAVDGFRIVDLVEAALAAAPPEEPG